MNDIADDMESDILIFADDMSLIASGSGPTEQLNRDLSEDCLKANKKTVCTTQQTNT